MKYFYLILFILFINCNLNDKNETHGISNLKLKLNNIKINTSNQNDISNLFGPPLVIDSFDKNLWSYFEIKKKNNIFGNKVLVLNDVVILKFNNAGVLTNYESFDITNLKKINFSEETTKTYAVNDDFIRGLMSSTKKRWDLSRERLKSNEQ